jgi:serine O-acetyltransferase
LDQPRDLQFRLRAYLAADLRRSHSLVAPGAPPLSRLALVGKLFSPRFTPVLLCRLAYWLYLRGLGPLAKLVSLVNFTVFGIEIAVRCRIGKGLFFPHTQGAVIGALSIGENATIYHNVTLGAREIDMDYTQDSRPVVGDNVLIGSGAKVLGGIVIGDGARIGTNAVVMRSVPAGGLARAPLAEIITQPQTPQTSA